MAADPVVGIRQIREWCRAIKPEVDRLYQERGATDRGTRPVANEGEAAESGGAPLSKEAKAIAALIDHPDWTGAEIAGAAGCSRTSLYRMPDFVRAKEILQQAKEDMPRGSKNGDDGTIEAWGADAC